jgi:hypothetical protein
VAAGELLLFQKPKEVVEKKTLSTIPPERKIANQPHNPQMETPTPILVIRAIR